MRSSATSLCWALAVSRWLSWASPLPRRQRLSRTHVPHTVLLASRHTDVSWISTDPRVTRPTCGSVSRMPRRIRRRSRSDRASARNRLTLHVDSGDAAHPPGPRQLLGMRSAKPTSSTRWRWSLSTQRPTVTTRDISSLTQRTPENDMSLRLKSAGVPDPRTPTDLHRALDQPG